MSDNNFRMPLYIGDYLSDTMELNGAQHGAYLLLLMYYWRNGPLPTDDARLSAIARTERRIWDRDVWPVVKAFFRLGSDGLLHQKRADIELAKAEEANARVGQERQEAAERMRRLRASRNGGGDPPTGDGNVRRTSTEQEPNNGVTEGERSVFPPTPPLSSQSQSQSFPPNPPAERGGTQRDDGGVGNGKKRPNSRADGTNPRALENRGKAQYRNGFHEVDHAERRRHVTITATTEEAQKSVVYLDQVLGRISNG